MHNLKNTPFVIPNLIAGMIVLFASNATIAQDTLRIAPTPLFNEGRYVDRFYAGASNRYEW
ncbi:MAG: hypothetical protein EA359_07155 [Balneolaceae bacterium]|nr:MAG: hypothetical protein EA359_07155 [Balneolaceae bacterium]